jgi:hypothetical protein
MTCPHCANLLRKFYRADRWVRVCVKCQPYKRAVAKASVPKRIGLSDEVMALVRTGMPYVEVAKQLGIRAKAVRMYVTNAKRHAA